MFFKLFWYKVFVHWKLHILNFLVDSVLMSFAKLLTDWNTRHSLKRVIMYSSTKAITSFKQTNISLFLESEETFGYIQTGNTSTDYGHVTWQLSGLVTCNANLGKLKGLITSMLVDALWVKACGRRYDQKACVCKSVFDKSSYEEMSEMSCNEFPVRTKPNQTKQQQQQQQQQNLQGKGGRKVNNSSNQ